MDPQFLDCKAAGEYLDTTERHMRRLVAEKRIRYYKLGKYTRFAIADLDAFAAAGRIEPGDAA